MNTTRKLINAFHPDNPAPPPGLSVQERSPPRCQRFRKFMTRLAPSLLALLTGLPALVQADFGTRVEAPEGGEWIRLSSFTWEALPEQKEARGAEYLEERRIFMSGRIPPEQGPGMVVLAKPVTLAIPGLSEHCGKGATLPVLRLDVPVWDTRFPTDEVYFQRYELGQVSVENCQHLEGAVADALWLRFALLKKTGEPRPLEQ